MAMLHMHILLAGGESQQLSFAQVVPRKFVTRKHAIAVDMYDQVNAFLSISKTQASDTACELHAHFLNALAPVSLARTA